MFIFAVKGVRKMAGLVGIGVAASVAIGLVRGIFFIIDAMVYSLAGVFYGIALNMYDINRLIDGIQLVKRFSEFVYSFLAVFMFFRVAFSLIQMLIDPSKIDDKQAGASTIIKNVLLTIVLLAVVPLGFRTARQIQTDVIENKVIEKVIYGNEFNEEGLSNVGHKLAINVWGLFIKPQGDADSNVKKAWESIFDPTKSTNVWDVAGFLAVINTRSGILGGGQYNISYLFLLSTLAGVYVVWTMIKLAIDVAYRSIKFLVMELISPIAIVSYVDPKSSKDGIFAKWLKETFKTYLSLFTRIGIYAIASILLFEISDAFKGDNIYVEFTYLLALLAFIKNAPKMLDGILGTEISKESETKFATDLLRSGYGAIGNAAVSLGTAAVMSRGMNRVDRTKLLLNSGIKGAQKGWSAAKKDGMMGVIKSGYGSYKDIQKETGSLDWWQKQSNKENSNLSDRVDAAKDPAKNLAIARFMKKDSNGNLILVDGKAQVDTDKMNEFLSKNGYKNIDASDPNVAYIVNKRSSKEGELIVLGEEGYSREGINLQRELAELQQNASLDKMELDSINSKMSQLNREKSNVSIETSISRGYSVAKGGAYSTEQRAVAAYTEALNIQYNSAVVAGDSKAIVELEKKIKTISIEEASKAGYRVATSDDKIYASEEDMLQGVMKNYDDKLNHLEAQQAEATQRYNKNSGNIEKKKAQIKRHHQNNRGDGQIIERLAEGDKITGRDKD